MSAGSQQTLADRIDACLPQTQCTQCGYPHCRAYAEAIVRGEADINQCPPGGDITIEALANLLARPAKPLNPACGTYQPRRLAVIVESDCIGCTLCIQACPVDAILGAAKLMHTIIAEECTGCELCLPPCPVDCIDMVPFAYNGPRAHWPWPDYSREQADRARPRAQARLARLAHRPQAPSRSSRTNRRTGVARTPSKDEIRREIAACVRRARVRKAQRTVATRRRP
ncbi:MAG: RnfABCDGE type electron transport complex subunit B [Acidiferrobacterales bacterium]